MLLSPFVGESIYNIIRRCPCLCKRCCILCVKHVDAIHWLAATLICFSLLCCSLLASPSVYKIHWTGLNISEESLIGLCQPNILQVSSSLFLKPIWAWLKMCHWTVELSVKGHSSGPFEATPFLSHPHVRRSHSAHTPLGVFFPVSPALDRSLVEKTRGGNPRLS